MKAEDAIARLDGTLCGFRSTSCPDQIAKNLKKALEEMNSTHRRAAAQNLVWRFSFCMRRFAYNNAGQSAGCPALRFSGEGEAFNDFALRFMSQFVRISSK